jgi:hypothetical protein
LAVFRVQPGRWTRSLAINHPLRYDCRGRRSPPTPTVGVPDSRPAYTAPADVAQDPVKSVRSAIAAGMANILLFAILNHTSLASGKSFESAPAGLGINAKPAGTRSVALASHDLHAVFLRRGMELERFAGCLRLELKTIKADPKSGSARPFFLTEQLHWSHGRSSKTIKTRTTIVMTLSQSTRKPSARAGVL